MDGRVKLGVGRLAGRTGGWTAGQQTMQWLEGNSSIGLTQTSYVANSDLEATNHC